MVKNEKTEKLKIEFYLYVFFTYAHLFIRIINYRMGFLSDHADHVLYTAKLLICILTVFLLRNKIPERHRGVLLIMKFIIAFSVWELLVSVLGTDPSYALGLTLFLIPVIANTILDFFLYLELCNSDRDQKVWVTINVALLVSMVLSTYVIGLFIILVCLTFVRFVMALVIILASPFPDIEGIDVISKWNVWGRFANKKNSKRLWIAIIGAYAFVLCVVTFNGLHKSRENDVLKYDDNGIAWDNKGHFIDQEGNTVITMPWIVSAKTSTMTKVFNPIYALVKSGKGYYHKYVPDYKRSLNVLLGADDSYIAWHNSDDKFYEFDYYDSDEIEHKQYFYNHVTAFYSDVKGGYGLVNDQGQIIVEPVFYSYKFKSPNVLRVRMRRTGEENVFTLDGKQLFKEDNNLRSIEFDDKNKLVWGEVGHTTIDENANESLVADYEGNIIYSGITGVDEIYDDKIVIKKIEGHDEVKIVIDWDGNEE